MSIKSKIKNNRILIRLLNFSRRLFGKNKIKVAKGNSVKIDGAINGAKITVNGKGNDIAIKDHIWVGYHATILKGVTIEKDSIVGARSVVTKSFDKQGVALAGSPARVVKENINWDSKRLPIKESHE